MATLFSEHNFANPHKAVINETLKDPTKKYDSPEDVFIDDKLSIEHKKKILENWRLDAEALLRAEEESMLSTNLSNKPSKLLQRINNLIAKLD